jgi:hypothetical protein
MPAYGSDRPADYWAVPENKISSDVFLTSDSCVIADKFFYIRGCIDIPLIDSDEKWTLGVWISLKEENFMIWQENYYQEIRNIIGPFFGWLCSSIPCYDETRLLKTMAHIQNNGIRPRIIIEESDHQLSIDQRDGVTTAYAWKMIHILEKYNKESN